MKIKGFKTKGKKHVLTVAGLAAFCFTAVIVCGMSVYAQTWTPFKEINLSKTGGSTKIIVDFETKVPVKAYVEYGTDPSVMLKKEIGTKDFVSKKTFKIAHVLPGKEHFVRLTATTEEGDEFKSRFVRVK